MIEISNILRLCVLIFTLFIFIISIFAYYRNPHKRLLLVSIAFTIFLVKGILLCFGILYNSIENLNSSGLENLFDLMIITFFIITIIKK